MKLLRLLSVVLVICFCTSNLDAKIYIWTDESGVKHYSNTPPSRQDAEVVEEIQKSESDETTVNEESREFDETGVNEQSEESKEKANDSGNNNIALRVAANNGSLEEVQRLLGEGADINAGSDNGMTPLILASWNGHMSVVALLLGEGADVAAKTKEGSTALTLAGERNHTQVITLLRQYGARE
ncbi:ankyrin repeat domain-containing protein [Thermodesulfobacteriota bacterium]